MQKYPRAKGAAGPVKLERKVRGPEASFSLAGDVSPFDIGQAASIYNLALPGGRPAQVWLYKSPSARL
jgi:hypothetical protein